MVEGVPYDMLFQLTNYAYQKKTILAAKEKTTTLATSELSHEDFLGQISIKRLSRLFFAYGAIPSPVYVSKTLLTNRTLFWSRAWEKIDVH